VRNHTGVESLERESIRLVVWLGALNDSGMHQTSFPLESVRPTCVPIFLRVDESEKAALSEEALRAGLSLNAYLCRVLACRPRIDLCGGETHGTESAPVVACLRDAFGASLIAVYRLYDTRASTWRGVAIVDEKYAYETRRVNRIRKELRNSWSGAEAIVYRYAEAARVVESIRQAPVAPAAANAGRESLPESSLASLIAPAPPRPTLDRAFLTWAEFALHAAPVYLADDRVPRALRAIRVRAAEGEWSRASATGAWTKNDACSTRKEKAPAAFDPRDLFMM
jgi:hypothetical protein